MKLAILKEIRPGETRVAASPETVKKLVDIGVTVAVEKGAGASASFSDGDFKSAGATIGASAAATLK
ncbi:MAG TPA: NAD(P)(+) transhydrogenase (Re/Si-specific) subunit alpha, partial [Rhodospirillaceae bacterium]|nr:NAD(P)(+) transhydrogenase (Re/Si-specific) subunit alpha [Rhodospirillaceae bacterium]